MSDHDKTPRNPSARTWTRLGPGALSGLLAGGAAAALGRPDSTGVTDAFPSVLGAIAGAVLLYLLAGLLPADRKSVV